MPTEKLEEKRVEAHVGEGVEGERKSTGTRERKRERKRFGSSFYVFSSTWACPMQIRLSQECCFFYLKSSLWSLDFPLTFLCSIFMGFSLPCLIATAILNSFSLFYLPNRFYTVQVAKKSG